MSSQTPAIYSSHPTKWQRRAADTVLALSIILTVLMILAPFAGDM